MSACNYCGKADPAAGDIAPIACSTCKRKSKHHHCDDGHCKHAHWAEHIKAGECNIMHSNGPAVILRPYIAKEEMDARDLASIPEDHPVNQNYTLQYHDSAGALYQSQSLAGEVRFKDFGSVAVGRGPGTRYMGIHYTLQVDLSGSRYNEGEGYPDTRYIDGTLGTNAIFKESANPAAARLAKTLLRFKSTRATGNITLWPDFHRVLDEKLIAYMGAGNIAVRLYVSETKRKDGVAPRQSDLVTTLDGVFTLKDPEKYTRRNLRSLMRFNTAQMRLKFGKRSDMPLENMESITGSDGTAGMHLTWQVMRASTRRGATSRQARLMDIEFSVPMQAIIDTLNGKGAWSTGAAVDQPTQTMGCNALDIDQVCAFTEALGVHMAVREALAETPASDTVLLKSHLATLTTHCAALDKHLTAGGAPSEYTVQSDVNAAINASIHALRADLVGLSVGTNYQTKYRSKIASRGAQYAFGEAKRIRAGMEAQREVTGNWFKRKKASAIKSALKRRAGDLRVVIGEFNKAGRASTSEAATFDLALTELDLAIGG